MIGLMRSLTLKTRLYAMIASMVLGFCCWALIPPTSCAVDACGKALGLAALVESGLGVIQQQYELQQAGNSRKTRPSAWPRTICARAVTTALIISSSTISPATRSCTAANPSEKQELSG